MKKFSKLLLILFVLFALYLGIGSMTASAETYVSGNLKYTVENGEAIVVGFESYNFYGELNIPAYLGGYPVREIGETAFYYETNITAVTLPDTVTRINKGAFYYCSSITSINIPSSVTTLGEHAFQGCSSITSITIPSSITDIPKSAFSECTSLENITIPSSIKTIGDQAFFGCDGFTSITIPDNVTFIDEEAFYDCDKVTTITVGKGVTSIGDDAFAHNDSLTKVNYNAISAVSNDAYGSPFAYGKLDTVVIGSSVKTIPVRLFYSNSALTKVTIGSAVTTIDEYAFAYCDALTSIVIPNKVTTIKPYAFSCCSALKKVTLPQTVKTIGSNAFEYCFKIEKTYFTGSSSTWKKVSVGSSNDYLSKKISCVGAAKVSSFSTTTYGYENAKIAVKVTATGTGLKYKWQVRTSSKGSWVNTTAAGYNTKSMTVIASPSRNGYQYRCIITDSVGNSVTTSITTLKIVPKITKQPVSVKAAHNTKKTFTTAATGTSVKYQWQVKTSSKGSWKNATFSGKTSKTLTVPATTARNGYQFRCRITGKYGTIYTSTVKMTVSKPKVTKQPVAVKAAKGTKKKFTITATGVGLKYQWQVKTSSRASWKNVTFTGRTSKTLTVPVIASRNGYQFRCRVTDAGKNVVYSKAVKLTVVPIKITKQPKNCTAKNNIVKYSVTATGDGLKYQWQSHGSHDSWKNINGATSKSMSSYAYYRNNGAYVRCRITDAGGNVLYTKTVRVYVR